MSRGSVAASVARSKELHPELFCPTKRCLWRTGGGSCPRHPSHVAAPPPSTPLVEEVPDSELKVGDMVDVLGAKRITAILPYRGPHEFITGIVETAPGVGFSLERGGYTRRFR